jgi:hypothetical protein
MRDKVFSRSSIEIISKEKTERKDKNMLGYDGDNR